MKTRLSAVFLVWLLLDGGIYGQEPAPDEKAALAPLGHFAGNWEKRFTIYTSRFTSPSGPPRSWPRPVRTRANGS
jgi:hypothetical protein